MATRRKKGNKFSLSNSELNGTATKPEIQQIGLLSKSAKVITSIILVIVLWFLAAVYYTRTYTNLNNGIVSFVGVQETVPKRVMKVNCSTDYDEELDLFPECTPRWCGRVVTDSVVSVDDSIQLLRIAKAGFEYGESDGGASILDLHSGALSKGSQFVNIYSVLDQLGTPLLVERDLQLYKRIKTSIRSAIVREFGVNESKLFLTKPTFFSRMTNKPAMTVHDEYWHTHVDKVTYGSFDYTSLLYLSDYGTDFTGGRFVFADRKANVTVEPRIGRVSFFTSGSENPHYVEKVYSGVRYAITVSFTCDPNKSISDPTLS